ELIQAAVSLETLERFQLRMSRSTGANEIRVVSVGETVRAGLRLPHHRALVEYERGIARAGKRERFGNPLEAFRIGDHVIPALADVQRDVLLRRSFGDELRRLFRLGPHLEVRR